MKKSFNLLLILFMLVSIFLMSGNTMADVQNPDKFIFATNEEIPTLDPAVSYENTGFRVMYVMYDRLVTYGGSTTEINPMLATSWEISEDSKSYTFHLRKDAKFHDGSPVTAEDVKYSFVRLLKIGKGPSGLFSGIIDEKSVKIIDDYTVRFDLLTVYPPFLTMLGMNMSAIVNSELVKEHENDGDYGEEWLTENEAGSGSFKLDSWKRGEKLVMKACKNYWGDEAKIDEAVIKFIVEPSTQRMLLEKGEIDMAEAITREAQEELKKHEAITVKEIPGLSIHYIALNASKSPLDNVKVRKAISKAVNYDEIIDGVYLGHSIRLNSPVPKGLFGHDENVPVFEYDLEEAKKLLKEAGYNDGFDLEFIVADIDTWTKVATVLQYHLSKVNIDVKISKYAWPTYLEKIMNGDHDLCMMGWSPDFADPDQNMYTFLHSDNFGDGWNFTFYKNEEINEMLEEARSTTDKEVRQDLYSNIAMEAYKEVPYLWVSQNNVVSVYRSWVKNYTLNPMMYWYVPFNKIEK